MNVHGTYSRFVCQPGDISIELANSPWNNGIKVLFRCGKIEVVQWLDRVDEEDDASLVVKALREIEAGAAEDLHYRYLATHIKNIWTSGGGRVWPARD